MDGVCYGCVHGYIFDDGYVRAWPMGNFDAALPAANFAT